MITCSETKDRWLSSTSSLSLYRSTVRIFSLVRKHKGSITTQTSFHASDYIRDIRAAGGTIELTDRGFSLSYLRDHSRVEQTEKSYFGRINADPDHRELICCELEAEVAAS